MSSLKFSFLFVTNHCITAVCFVETAVICPIWAVYNIYPETYADTYSFHTLPVCCIRNIVSRAYGMRTPPRIQFMHPTACVHEKDECVKQVEPRDSSPAPCRCRSRVTGDGNEYRHINDVTHIYALSLSIFLFFPFLFKLFSMVVYYVNGFSGGGEAESCRKISSSWWWSWNDESYNTWFSIEQLLQWFPLTRITCLIAVFNPHKRLMLETGSYEYVVVATYSFIGKINPCILRVSKN